MWCCVWVLLVVVVGLGGCCGGVGGVVGSGGCDGVGGVSEVGDLDEVGCVNEVGY